MTSRRRAAVSLLLLLVSAQPVMADPNDGAISGQIVNKTADGGPTNGISVRLVTFGRKEDTALGERTVQSDENGRYTFTGLDRDANLVYVPFVRYGEVNYRPDQLARLQDQAGWQLDIPVYESTGDDRAIQFDELNLLLLDANQGMLSFMEMGALLNASDRTYVSANPDDVQTPGIRFPLPRAAQDIQVQSGFTSQDVATAASGLQLISPVEPGTHEFALSFRMAYSSSNADVTLQLPYPTQSYAFFVPQGAAHLDSVVLAAGGSEPVGGQTYAVYGASDLPRGAVVAGQLGGLTDASGETNQIAILGVVVLLCGALGGIVLMNHSGRNRTGLRSRTAARAARPVGTQERLDLVVRIAVLDERFAAGEVSQTEYAAERKLAKQRLRELTSARTYP